MTDFKPDLQAIADLVARHVSQASQDSIELMRQRNREENQRRHGCDCDRATCYISCPRYLTHYATADEFWGWWIATKPPDFRDREVHPPGEPGRKASGSRRKRKKKPPKSWFSNPYLE